MSALMEEYSGWAINPIGFSVKKFEIQNRRFLGNKFNLLSLIQDVVEGECKGARSFFDIFSGTGVVGHKFNSRRMKIISNDIMKSNFCSLKTFLSLTSVDEYDLADAIDHLNKLKASKNNYFLKTFGGRYFSNENAKKIGAVRQEIENMSLSHDIKCALLTSLLYATDKVANTVGHYDAYRKEIDMLNPVKLLVPSINQKFNKNNEIYCEDANQLVRKIKVDVLYIDPPYNSRQYCDLYHVLENLITWEKPEVFGKAKKMDRSHLKSEYCLKNAPATFDDLIQNANCKYILVSYNNTGSSRDCRSNARIADNSIMDSLSSRGMVKVFEQEHGLFTTGKSSSRGNSERLFFCKVKK